jgi:hypothetical protein
MNNSPEDFEKLQKLLKVKRHEQPPPGYFNNFSTKVISGIERQDDSDLGGFRNAPWLRRFLGTLETNPFAAGVFGASICGLLVSGIAWSQFRAPDASTAEVNSSMAVADNSMGSTSMGFTKVSSVDSLAPSFAPLGSNLSAGLFSGGGTVGAEPVNFSIAH